MQTKLKTYPAIDPTPELASLVTLWLNSDSRRSLNTHEAYRRDLFQFFYTCGSQDPAEVKPMQVTEYQAQLRADKLADKTVARKIAVLRSFFKFLHKNEFLVKNPTSHIEIKPVTTNQFDKHTLSEEEIKKIIAAAPTQQWKVFLRLLYMTAFRVSEATTFTWGQIKETESGVAKVNIIGKGNKERTVFLLPELWADLRELRQGASTKARVFPFHRTGVLRAIKRFARDAGIANYEDVSPHWFRHSHASHSLANGATLVQIKNQLGHANIATTSLYLHGKEDELSAQFLKIK